LVCRHGVDSSESTIWWTPAKVNLFLAVPAKRADGYHEIETLVVAVTLFDTLEFKVTPEPELHFSCEWAAGIAAQINRGQSNASESDLGDEAMPWDALPANEENLVWHALHLFRQRAEVKQGARVRLVKRIPAAAGLGGASSDAATALVAANVAWHVGWSIDQLIALAAEFGSDVPFFVRSRPEICRGRGERMERVTIPGGRPLVIVRPPGGLSTPEVFRNCEPGPEPTTPRALIHALRHGDPAKVKQALRNRLQPPAERLSLWIPKLMAALKREGGASQMTGSGSSCFLIANHRRQARRLAARLRGEGWQAACSTVTTDHVEQS
jgi:4-diphosphocytidyl-2-C-methyl-D-erythritol kinase